MRSVFRTVSNLYRVVKILSTFARHDALFLDELKKYTPLLARCLRILSRPQNNKRPGQKLVQALIDSGPVFIKFGQLLSTRADLVGESIANDLAVLQDNLPPFPFQDVKETVETELQQKLSLLFQWFDTTPVAAASIAQVHFATTSDGKAVAVKVLRPQIEQAFQRNIDFLYWLAERVLYFYPRIKRLKPVQALQLFEHITRIEMNLRMEGAAASEFGENFHKDPTFKVPEVDWRRTTQRVLTLERIDGIKIDEVEQLRTAGLDPHHILKIASAAFFNQVFRDGFFHADLHPGNLFVLKDGRLVVVDFGIMGRLDRKTRIFLADMLLGFLSGDYRRVAKVHFQAGYVPPHQSLETFMQAARSIGEPLLNKPLNQISIGSLLRHLFITTQQFEMPTQPQLLLLQKSILTAEGIGRKLNPDVNMWALSQPLIEKWIAENRGLEAQVRDEYETFIQTLTRIPPLLQALERRIHTPVEQEHLTGVSKSRREGFSWFLWTFFLLLLLLLFVL